MNATAPATKTAKLTWTKTDGNREQTASNGARITRLFGRWFAVQADGSWAMGEKNNGWKTIREAKAQIAA